MGEFDLQQLRADCIFAALEQPGWSTHQVADARCVSTVIVYVAAAVFPTLIVRLCWCKLMGRDGEGAQNRGTLFPQASFDNSHSRLPRRSELAAIQV